MHPPARAEPTKVLLVHERYVERGGEDEAVDRTADLLTARDHAVLRYTLDNRAIDGVGRLALARDTIWSTAARRELARLVAAERPAVAHFHNTFPLVSPAAYGVVRSAGVPVVQTLHNYRLLCPNALLFRDGAPCEDCLPKTLKWPGIAHACYRDDRSASAVTATMLAVHHALGTFTADVDAYVALTAFARGKFVAGGLPAERIAVCPNFLARDPGVGAHRGGYALFVGRLSAEKGIVPLLDAWRRAAPRGTLRIVGDGPLGAQLPRDLPTVEYLGRRSADEVLALMRDAAFLVVPSTCYESFPLAIVEAFATGLPVLASAHGAMAEIVEDGVSGMHVAPGDVDAWAAALARPFDRPDEIAALGAGARRAYETRYTPDVAYRALVGVYATALRRGAAYRR